ncbi:sulfatase-like hydrolase/transferase [Haloplanus rubicundus]|uniref:Sulfatase N-terminal domain-containing protein n=1 Tax=Haloplanus rubicundus TaxID=1547898 RepID=A0A345EBY0_9EURY|nr:sulfatase-like hydrolase/transferase [Haloplanus rubicundus]AXG09702.1 hypothetical protein DU484_07410 [Haloplanus rubicundus]
MTRPNILFLIWDSARFDYVMEHAPTFSQLASDNLSFTNAIAPATWSLPSHTSLFTGTLPHTHGTYHLNHSVSELTIGSELEKKTYQRFAVSGNGFFSIRYGFETAFDEFYYSRERFQPFGSGLPARSRAYHMRRQGYSKPDIFFDLLKSSFKHENTIGSLANLGDLLRTELHNLMAAHTSISARPSEYSAKRNTQKLLEILQRAQGSDRPWFIVANYMDCHRPYDPPAEFRKKHLDDDISPSEFDRLTEKLMPPWKFIEAVDSGEEISETDLRMIRQLYAAEVERVDTHLKQLLTELEANSMRDNTLIIVTADHGENLGEQDSFGRRRMGHESSVSDQLLHVPLLIAHPDLSAQTVDQRMSIRALHDLIIRLDSGKLQSDDVLSTLLPDPGTPILAEYPIVGGEEIREKYPKASEESLADRLSRHTVVGYLDDWKLVASSGGDRHAWRAGAPKNVREAPDIVRNYVEGALEKLTQQHPPTSGVTAQKQEELEALGYL